MGVKPLTPEIKRQASELWRLVDLSAKPMSKIIEQIVSLALEKERHFIDVVEPAKINEVAASVAKEIAPQFRRHEYNNPNVNLDVFDAWLLHTFAGKLGIYRRNMSEGKFKFQIRKRLIDIGKLSDDVNKILAPDLIKRIWGS